MKTERKINSNFIYLKITGNITIRDIETLAVQFRAISHARMPLILDMRNVKIMHIRTGNALSFLRKAMKAMSTPLTVICTDPYHISILNFFDYEIFYLITPDLSSAKHSVMHKVCI